jgi:hypothetical protein
MSPVANTAFVLDFLQAKCTNVNKCATKHIADIIKYRRLKWLEHVYRMSNEHLPKILLFGSLDGTGLRGRPIKSWSDCVRQDSDNLGMSLTWKRTCQIGQHGEPKLMCCCNAPEP